MIEIFLSGIKKYYGANQVLKDITFQVLKEEKVGIVGRNGTGKTTLFKIIAGIENCDKGSITISKGSQIGWLEQIPNCPREYRVIDVLNMAFHDELNIQSTLKELKEKMSYAKGRELDSMIQRYGELQHAFEIKGGYKIEEKLSRLCNGLGLDKKFLSTKLKI